MLTVADALRRGVRRHPQALAVADERERLTHGELARRAWALARGLREAGVRPGETVGILTGNSVFSAETFLGVVVAGAVAVPYNWRWAVPELVFALNDSRARVVLVEREWAESVEAAAATGELQHVERVVRQGAEYEELLRFGPEPGLAGGPESGSVILYTGGTTGFPKGVLLTHRNVMANALNEIVDTDMEPDDRTLLIAPMYHSASLLCWFLPHLVLGAASILVRAFDEEQVAGTIAREGVTNGFFIPNMVRRMLASGQLPRHDLSSFRRLYVGGASFRLPDKRAVRDELPGARIYYQYGLTEAGPIVTRLRPEDMFSEELDGSIGQEILLNDVTIRGDDGELPDGEVGELCVRGPNVMAGYFERPEATAAVMRDGWLRTGDLALRSPEGYFFYRDRLKDMIKTGGENVYSAEVEQVLYGHPLIAEAAVLGVPSDEWDEEVRAVIALRPGASLTADDLRAHCRRHLAGYKVPKRIVFLPMSGMPVSPSGKILKRELRERPLW
ncbi:MAG TPA: AMP-binding protein [Candidatus Dormibacteraeota bacterium]|nr:AMP-binding protein [Candidatus Dormibacteraeota bacterium]